MAQSGCEPPTASPSAFTTGLGNNNSEGASLRTKLESIWNTGTENRDSNIHFPDIANKADYLGCIEIGMAKG